MATGLAAHARATARAAVGRPIDAATSAYERVAPKGMAASADKIRVRPGFDPDCDMGPLVSEEQMNRVCGYLESGKKEGAKALAGGERHGDQGYFVKPTVLVDTNENMKVVKEEIFGPVVTATPFTDTDDLIRKANDSVYGLAAGIWTRDLLKQEGWPHPGALRGVGATDVGQRIVYVSLVLRVRPLLELEAHHERRLVADSATPRRNASEAHSAIPPRQSWPLKTEGPDSRR